MSSVDRTRCRRDEASGDVETVMVVARVLVGLSARSVASVEKVVTLPQLRVLVMVFDRAALSTGALANALGVHPSSASRLIERLVVAGLIDRSDNPADRRTVLLTLTPTGRALVERVMDHRRAAITEVLDRMPVVHRRTLVAALRSFAAAGVEATAAAGHSLDWTAAS